MEIIGHRGALYMAPENTLASVMLAWRQNVDIVEIDVHLSLDGRLMVMHDASTLRTTGVDLLIAQTSSDELRALDAGIWKGPEFAGEKIPFLEEVIATIPAGRKLFVEVKCAAEAIDVLERTFSDSGKAEQIVVIGFDIDTISAFKRTMPSVPVYWLQASGADDPGRSWKPYDPSLIDTAAGRGLDGLDLHYGGVAPQLVAATKAAGMRFYAWTVNDPDCAVRLRDMGVDGIGVDCPGWMIEQLRLREE